ncbi:MAG: hypothetical protein QF489_03580 [Planctomycetota bacterium]|nr:hypothetical protein [Planctomycetota bacterium]
MDVLRQREDREVGTNSPSSGGAPPPPRSFDFTIPSAVFKTLGGLVLVVLVLWGLFAALGGSEKVTYGILVNRYELTRQEQGQNDGRALLGKGYDDVNLVRVSDASGQEQLALYVGADENPEALQDLLEKIQNTSLEGSAGENPFRGASIEPRPGLSD